jgi:tRNA/tmRNA/rRNA uracil-C5-methylase (TrmA/RlmC/RlmD family)
MTGKPVVDWTGRRLDVEVEAVAHGGHCVARHSGRVVFVRHALPGERATVEVTEDHGKSFCRADAVEILRAAPQRVEPPCPLAAPGRCGGCDWQHATPELQRELKATVVAEQLRRLGGLERAVVVEPLEPLPLGWRTRVRLAVGRDGRAGLRVHRSHRVIPLEQHGCAISAPGMLDDVLSRRWRPGSELEVTADGAGRTHVRVVEKVRGREQARQVQGGEAHERAADREWRLQAHGFWQGHPAAADVYARVVGEYAQATPGSHAWDLYAGVGLFAAVLAGQVGERGSVLAVESSRQAVADGQRNLADLPQVSWQIDRVDRALAQPPELRPEVVVLDPPRKGAGRPVVDAIAAAAPQRVVYVACDPAALARDVATFAEHGYRLTELRAFDAFPMTHHVECIALLRPSAR